MTTTMKVQIAENLCIACGLCREVCPERAIHPKMQDIHHMYEVIASECTGCGDCLAYCPEPGALNPYDTTLVRWIITAPMRAAQSCRSEYQTIPDAYAVSPSMVNLTSTRRATGNFPADTVTWEVPVFIMALTFLVFLPAQWNGFTNWDDPLNLINNNQYRGFGWTQLRWMFTTFHGTLYRPATWLTLALDHRLWGMDPAGYHLTSVLFHCLNAAIFYYIALALLRLARAGTALYRAGL